MFYDLVLKGGNVLTAEGIFSADLAIKDGKIAAVGTLIGFDAKEIVDVKGLTVLPGAIDTQVHFREPGFEQKEDIQTGTQSAVCGGVTTVLEMPNTNPATVSEAALNDKLARAKGRAWCNIGFFIGASAENAHELDRLEGLPGTPGVKIFMGSSTGSLLVPDDDTLREVLRHGRKTCPIHAEDAYRLESRKALISSHPSVLEHPFLRDVECARLATERILRLSQETGRPVHILHVSTADELPMILEAKRKGLGTTAEATPQHLYFSGPECYERLSTLAQMNPPIRDKSHRLALRRALSEGLFDVIGSDHAPHTLEEKAKPYPSSPSGMPGVQTLLPVMLTLARSGLLHDTDVVKLTSRNPAALYQIQNKGEIKEGFDADLALFDLEKEWVVERSWIKSKSGWSPFEGETLRGLPVHTLVGGQFALRDGALSEISVGRIPQFSRDLTLDTSHGYFRSY